MNILGIETSCDETAAAVVADGRRLLSSSVASQLAVHRPFRGVVPELASRAHAERINEIIDRALEEAGVPIHGVAVTVGPGLIGSLLVGVVTARTLGWVRRIPVIGVNHLEGHLFAGLVEHPKLKPPFLGLIVSGGHTELVIFKGYGRYERLGRTRDDAAGEAFDKVANLMGLSFPGGPSIHRMAMKGNPTAISFPRAWMPGTHDFSFSGIKTAVANYLNANTGWERRIPDICASFQEAVVEVIVKKTMNAARLHRLNSVVVGGGVAANSRLRRVFEEATVENHLRLYLSHPAFCTDNAAMIAAAGYYRLKHGKQSNLALKADANLLVKCW